jgi:hypothetical protein
MRPATRLQTLLSRKLGNIGALLLMAEIEKAGSYSRSRRYRMVLTVDSSNMVAPNNLSTQRWTRIWTRRSHLRNGLSISRRENPAVQDTLGWIYYRKGIYHTTTKYLKAAVAQAPNPRRQLHLGLCYINRVTYSRADN